MSPTTLMTFSTMSSQTLHKTFHLYLKQAALHLRQHRIPLLMSHLVVYRTSLLIMASVNNILLQIISPCLRLSRGLAFQWLTDQINLQLCCSPTIQEYLRTTHKHYHLTSLYQQAGPSPAPHPQLHYPVRVHSLDHSSPSQPQIDRVSRQRVIYLTES